MADDRLKIWVIEDHQLLAEITSFRLELLGYEVMNFEKGKKALAFLDKAEAIPNLIILDMGLPDIDAFELINKFRMEDKTVETPIMVFSTDGDLNAVQRAYHAGARDFLVTPFDPAALESKIEGLLEVNADA